MGWTIAIIGGIVLLILIFGVVSYNRFVSQRQLIKDAWANIDTELRRRYDLMIPNLVETVRGYASHERTVFENVTRARAAATSATGSPAAQAAAEGPLVAALRQLFAVVENYPDLKANQNFLALQQELASTEDRLQTSRRFYNANVRDYNQRVKQFPSVIIASTFNFEEEVLQGRGRAPRAARPRWRSAARAPGVTFSGPRSRRPRPRPRRPPSLRGHHRRHRGLPTPKRLAAGDFGGFGEAPVLDRTSSIVARRTSPVSSVHTIAQTSATPPIAMAVVFAVKTSASQPVRIADRPNVGVTSMPSTAKVRPRIRSGSTTRWSPYDDNVHWAPPPTCATRPHPSRTRARAPGRAARTRPERRQRAADRTEQPTVLRAGEGPSDERPDQRPDPARRHQQPEPDLARVKPAELGGNTSTPPATPTELHREQRQDTVVLARVPRTVSTVSWRRLGCSQCVRPSANVAWIPRISNAESTNEAESTTIATWIEHPRHGPLERTADREHRAPQRPRWRVRDREVALVHQVRHRRHRGRLERGREHRGRGQQDVDQPGEVLGPYQEEAEDQDRWARSRRS